MAGGFAFMFSQVVGAPVGAVRVHCAPTACPLAHLRVLPRLPTARGSGGSSTASGRRTPHSLHRRIPHSLHRRTPHSWCILHSLHLLRGHAPCPLTAHCSRSVMVVLVATANHFTARDLEKMAPLLFFAQVQREWRETHCRTTALPQLPHFPPHASAARASAHPDGAGSAALRQCGSAAVRPRVDDAFTALTLTGTHCTLRCLCSGSP